MSDPTPIARALAVSTGNVDVDDIRWLREGFERAFADGVSIEIALGLPDTPARRRTAVRDYWLRRAAAACTEREPWAIAGELARAGRVFELRVWPRWRRAQTPPEGATDIEIALFRLYENGGRVPGERRVFDLLNEFTAANRKDIAVVSALRFATT